MALLELGEHLLVSVGNGSCASINEVSNSIDDHQRPHSHAGFHIITVTLILVVFDGHGTTSDVHDGSSEAEKHLQEIGGVGEEDVSNEERKWDKNRGTNGDDAHQLPVNKGLAVHPWFGTKMQIILSQQSNADEGQGNFDDFQEAAECADSFDVECQTHFEDRFWISLPLRST